MNNLGNKFDFDDISLIPAKISEISSRKEISILDDNNKLPLFVSPMDTVINNDNYQKFIDLGFYVCIPRNENYNNEEYTYPSECFISFGLDSIEFLLKNNITLPKRVLIDVANAHSIKVFKIAEEIKNKYDVELMIGNIANPLTYEEYAKIDVDYLRCGIGAGSACITSANTSIHYPMASLISECFEIKLQNNYKTKIIADGGFKNFDDVIKGLSLGADSIMLGNIINKSIESCGENYLKKDDKYYKIRNNDALIFFNQGKEIYKLFRGMSTKDVQKKWGKTELRTSEGIIKYNKAEYSIASWITNFSDYLKSCMSYQGIRNIHDFIGSSKFIFITQNARKRFNK